MVKDFNSRIWHRDENEETVIGNMNTEQKIIKSCFWVVYLMYSGRNGIKTIVLIDGKECLTLKLADDFFWDISSQRAASFTT